MKIANTYSARFIATSLLTASVMVVMLCFPNYIMPVGPIREPVRPR